MKVTAHDNGMPCWVDVMVATAEQHHDLRAFLSALYDWTWELGAPETGNYALAFHEGAPVLGLGYAEGMTGDLTTYFSTDDMAGALERATAAGATVVVPSMDVMDLGKMAVLIDPTGASVGLWEPGTFTGFGVQWERNAPGWFDHVSGDAAAAGAFYAEFLGHQLTELDPPMRILQNGEQWFASVSPLQLDEPPKWKPIYVVDSLARVHETVPRHGGAIVVESMPVPGSEICVFTEPINGKMMTVMQGGDQPA